ncbi:hypothetical protein ACS0TY_004705 [Phlomoides rotata]
MSRNYDNWERLVAAVIKRDQIWELCHQPSKSPSICSEASSYSSDFSSIQGSGFTLENNQESAQIPITKLVSLEGVWRSRELDKGMFGTSFLTKIWSDQVQVSDYEFLAVGTQLVMKKLPGEINHENVATPRAYYFSNNRYFIFNDYHSLGSLYGLLHGKRRGRLNWETRLKIAIGAARGIAHIHRQCGGKLAHGNVKSSNIFLNSKYYGRVPDFSLAGLMESPGKQTSEYKFNGSSQENDVYSFGVVLIQLLLGRSPVKRQSFWDDIHLVKWAHSIALEEWASKLFDQSLWSSELSYQSQSGILCDELDVFVFERGMELEGKIKAEMVEMLQVAMKCLAVLPQDIPKMFEVVFMLENIVNFGNTQSPNCEDSD